MRLDSDSDTILVVGKKADAQKRAAMEKNGVRIIEARLKDCRIDMPNLMEQLGAAGITSVLIEGGGQVIASALQSGIVDKIAFFYAPKILGGDDGIPICRGEGPAAMQDSIAVKNVSVQRFGDDVMIEGYIEKK